MNNVEKNHTTTNEALEPSKEKPRGAAQEAPSVPDRQQLKLHVNQINRLERLKAIDSAMTEAMKSGKRLDGKFTAQEISEAGQLGSGEIERRLAETKISSLNIRADLLRHDIGPKNIQRLDAVREDVASRNRLMQVAQSEAARAAGGPSKAMHSFKREDLIKYSEDIAAGKTPAQLLTEYSGDAQEASERRANLYQEIPAASELDATLGERNRQMANLEQIEIQKRKNAQEAARKDLS